MAERFYVTFPLAPGDTALQGPEAHHLATVMRARPGDVVCLFNGDGAEYPAIVVASDRKTVQLRVSEPRRPVREVPYELIVAAPLPKGDRGDFMIEKLTELGVTRFVPLKTQRSVVVPKMERLQRTVIEACKQCGRNVLMKVDPVTNWDAWIRASGLHNRRIVAHPEAAGIAEPQPALQDVAFAVGPEGGFTDEEIAAAMALDWTAVSLGPRTLRIETAAIALVAGWLLR